MASEHSSQFLLAADNSPHLLPLLRSNPSLASVQDDHGYSLIHAAVSYNHLDLVRTLVSEFKVDVDLKDEDGETALFVAETVECARILVEELHIDTTIVGEEGKTAGEKIKAEGDFPEVVAYLQQQLSPSNGPESNGPETNGAHESATSGILNPAPRLPQGFSVEIGTMAPEDISEDVDPEFRRRIEELADRGDFQSEEGQKQLRDLITEAIAGQVGEEREVRRRMD